MRTLAFGLPAGIQPSDLVFISKYVGIIAVVFPLLVVLRRRSPRAGLWTTGAISAGVSLMGLIWFVQRAFGL